jgi:hypothetical protein
VLLFVDIGQPMTVLVLLSPAQNCISKIENLSTNTSLQTLLLADNRIRSDGVELVLECPSITCLDLQNNTIEDPAVRWIPLPSCLCNT